MNLPHRWSRNFLNCCLCTGTWSIKSVCEPLKSRVSVSYSPGSPGCKRHWFSKPPVLGTHLCGAGPKSWRAWCRAWTPCSLGSSSMCPSVLWVAMLRCGSWWDCVSASPTQIVAFLSFVVEELFCLFSGLFQRELFHMVCPREEVSWRPVFLCHHLEPTFVPVLIIIAL